MDKPKDAPLWALNADYTYFRRKLDILRAKKKSGQPPHKRYATYEPRLLMKLEAIDSEIERRKERGS
jgi:hypothetical protein